jgi:hypothetical protein
MCRIFRLKETIVVSANSNPDAYDTFRCNHDMQYDIFKSQYPTEVKLQ